MSKKTLIVIGVALTGILLILVIYFLLFQNNSTQSGGTVNKFTNFFPFGGSDAPTTPGDTTIDTPTTPVNNSVTDFTKKLRRISTEPVAGAGIADFKSGSVIRHIEKATGHIYETELFSNIQNRISNTTLPLVYEAVWGNNNNSAIAQYLQSNEETIDTYSLSLKTLSTSTANTVSAVQFPDKISNVVTFGSNVFYVQQNTNASIGVISDFSGGKRRQVWNSPIKEILVQYINANTVSITTKPNKNIFGFMYFVNTNTGQMRKILGNTLGLSTLTSPDATSALVLSQGNNLDFSIYSIASKTYTEITPITFPEKCVWSKKDKNVIYCAVPGADLDSGDLDAWYLGSKSFSDSIWKYDLKNKTGVMIEDLLDEAGESIDVIKPILNDGEQYLIFINKTNGILWSLDLSK